MNVPFLNRWRKKALLGMDLGVSSVKLVTLQKEPGTEKTLLSHWIYPERVWEEGNWQPGKVDAFSSFLKGHGLNGVRVACNIEDSSLKIRRVDLPKMPEHDMKEALGWQLRDVVEGPVTDYFVRYSQLEEFSAGEARKVALIAYAVKKDVLKKLTDMMKRCSLEPVAVEPTSVSLLAAFDRLQGWKEGEYYGLIDFGESKSVFTVMGDGKLFFSRPLPGVSGSHLRDQMEKDLGLSRVEADILKRHFMTNEKLDEVLHPVREKAMALLPALLTRLSIETQRSMDTFSLMFRREKVDRLFLCGGGAGLFELKESLTKNLAVPTEILVPPESFETASPEPLAPYLFDVAIGLACYE